MYNIYCQHNKLSSLPRALFRTHACPSLRKLNVSHNELERVPAEIWTSESLQEVNFSHNRIHEVAFIGVFGGASSAMGSRSSSLASNMVNNSSPVRGSPSNSSQGNSSSPRHRNPSGSTSSNAVVDNSPLLSNSAHCDINTVTGSPGHNRHSTVSTNSAVSNVNSGGSTSQRDSVFSANHDAASDYVGISSASMLPYTIVPVSKVRPLLYPPIGDILALASFASTSASHF